MKVVLELQDQAANIKKITVRHDIVIGRGSDCNLRLSSPQVSRRHCFLRVGKDNASITDLDSSNGTYLEGKRLQSGKRFDLKDGSSLSIGPIRFLIRVRPEVIPGDVLNEPQLNDSISTGSSGKDRSGSTIIEAGREPLQHVPSNELRKNGSPENQVYGNQSDSAQIPDEAFATNIVSELEIIDLGKRAHEQFEADTASATGSRSEQMKSDKIEVVHDEIEVLPEEIEILADVEVLEDVVEVVEDDLEFIDDAAVEVVEVAEDEEERAPSSDWLSGIDEEPKKKSSPKADDGFGDELNKFLGGLK